MQNIHNFTTQQSVQIPVMRPLLPKADDIHKYLKEIDDARWYSNFGPLTTKLEERLAGHFKIGKDEICTFSNATQALVLVTRALNIPRGSYCAVPSWTFVASAGAVYNSDLIPFFIDVDEKTWAIEPDNLLQFKEKISTVVVVSPFGAPINIKKWQDFKAKTGIKIIIDAAASFDSIASFGEFEVSDIPIIVSLHATKPFGTGEGGFVLWKDKELLFKTRKMSNFGLAPEGLIVRGSNAKMSEYSAAVGLAELDNWQNKRVEWISLIKRFTEKLADVNVEVWSTGDYATSTMNVKLKYPVADDVISHLMSKGIESRRWWRKGCHNFEPYKDFPRQPLVVTNKLIDSVIALPFWLGISDTEIDEVVSALKEAVSIYYASSLKRVV